MNRRAMTIAEVVTVAGLGFLVAMAIIGIMAVVKNTYFRSSLKIDLLEQARYGMSRAIGEISQTASSKVEIYKCPANICSGGAIKFQVPVVTNDPITGSIYKPSSDLAKPIKWGLNGIKTASKIIYIVPVAGSPFGAYQNKLIRLTLISPNCGNGTCDPGESCPNCADCGICYLPSFDNRIVGFVDDWLSFLKPGTAYAQTSGPNSPPNISGYNDLPDLGNPALYNVKVLTVDAKAVYFLGTPGPGTGGTALSKPNTIQVFLEMAKENSLFSSATQTNLSSVVRLRNQSF